MNGALMGFSREEMKERLPAIEAFADIGEFIDQPVKIYSSGMFVRLAFAAAINVDPDILIVDEVLAVGDAKFQHKCFQKFLEFQRAGKTIVMVTHDMNAILKHCDSAILLENSSIVKSGKPKEVANCYYELLFTGALSSDEKLVSKEASSSLPHKTEHIDRELGRSEIENFLADIPTADICIQRKSYNKNEYRFGNRDGEILDYLLISGEIFDPTAVYSGNRIDIYVKVRFNRAVELPMIGFSIKTIDGITVYGSNTRFSKTTIQPTKAGDIVVFKFSIELSLIPGDFFIELGLAEKLPEKDIPNDIRKNLIHLTIQENNIFEGLAELRSCFEEVLRKR